LENSTEEVRLEKLGDLFRKQLCEYHWALELYRKALEIYKKILGEDHLDVANTYNNIANVMESHGKLEDAMELYRKALKIKKKTLGEEHWSVASTSNNMANVESQSKEEKEEFQAGSYDSMILMQTSMSMETRKQVTGIYSATMISSARKEQRKGTCLEVSLKGAAAKHDRPPIASRPILQRRYP
jgi:tetratricopeptide (TPR) repeat protein